MTRATDTPPPDPEFLARIASAVSEDRLWQHHMDLARFGATGRGGIDRQALSATEIEARGALVRRARSLGLTPYTDAIGNLFLRMEGRNSGSAPVVTGSHIDSQPTGGKFDGAFGVLAGLEAVEAFLKIGWQPRRPVEIVAWTNEEGSRFAPGMMGSTAYAGLRAVEEILAVRDAEGTSVKEALEAVFAADDNIEHRELGRPCAAFLEAHIEQGPRLEATDNQVGAVLGMQGTRRFRVRVTGEEAHAGTTPESERRDALVVAAGLIGALREFMHDPDDITRFTVGLFRVNPNAPSVVPAEVYFSIDLRHPEADVLADLGDRIDGVCHENRGPCDVEVEEISRAEPVHFPDHIPRLVSEVAESLDIPHMQMFSAAGHDARQLHYFCPTGMLFVPCEKGISHNESENVKSGDLAAGARVLAGCLAAMTEIP